MSDQSEITFTMYITILGHTVMMQLGKTANPVTGKTEMDVQQAKFTIDLLGMLETKTKGNLTKEEEEFLRSTLTGVRMKYIEEVDAEQKKKHKKEDS